MCVYKYALDVISKKPFMVKRKKSQELGTPGALSRDSHPYIFLTEVCKEHDLSAGGSKVELSNRLLNYYFSDPTRVPEYVSRHFPHGEWLKAKERDLALSSDIEFLCDNCLPPRTDPAVDDDDSSDDTSPLPSVRTTTITEFPLRVLAAVYHAKKLRLYPETETLFVCRHEFTTSLLDQALANIDTSPWDTQLVGQETQVLHRRTVACGLRLFVLLLADDVFYERLVNESAAGPLTRSDLDVSAIGDNSNFWVDVCTAFKDDNYLIPPPPINHFFFIDRATNQPYDISSCLSKWVTPGKLRKMYTVAYNLLVTYRTNFDRSGDHDFNSEEGLAVFVNNYCHGNKDCCFLAVLANWRGNSAMEWFSGQLPSNIQVVDGLDNLTSIVQQEPSPSESSFATRQTRADNDTRSQVVQMLDLLSSYKNQSSESPEKKGYFKQKTRVLEVVEQKKRLEVQTKKREATMALAREFDAAGNNIEDTSNEEKIQLKKRLATVSTRMWSRLLDEVEGEQNEGG